MSSTGYQTCRGRLWSRATALYFALSLPDDDGAPTALTSTVYLFLFRRIAFAVSKWKTQDRNKGSNKFHRYHLLLATHETSGVYAAGTRSNLGTPPTERNIVCPPNLIGADGGTRTHTTRACRRILSPLRLPIPPRPLVLGHKSRRPNLYDLSSRSNRVCILAPPPRSCFHI